MKVEHMRSVASIPPGGNVPAMGEVLFPCWDPVLLDLPGPIDIRWYGLMYIVGFIVGHYILVRLSRAKLLPIPEQKVGDLILWLVIGVMLGGRLGYTLFYSPEIWKTPYRVFYLWEGGLSFHGGLLGVVIAALWFARKNRIPFSRLCDSLALSVTPGIFAVRMANFVNGELYGRITDESVPWAMRFPTDPDAVRLMGIHPGAIPDRDRQIQAAIAEGKWKEVMEQVPLRHPSQLYEGVGEGLIVGLVLLVIYKLTRKNPLAAGAYSGVFLIGYGTVRFVIEFFRQPDTQFTDADDPVGTVFLGMTMGQLLCSAMILAGVSVIVLCNMKGRQPLSGSQPDSQQQTSRESGA